MIISGFKFQEFVFQIVMKITKLTDSDFRRGKTETLTKTIL